MKKLPLILNIVLLVAVAVLFVLHFMQPKEEQPAEKARTMLSDSLALPIAYIELDSILVNYEMFIDLQDELMKKQEQSEAELTSKSRTWERGAADYQDKMSKGLITRSQAQEVEAQLYQEQQNLIQLRDQMSMELAEEKQVTDRQVMYSIIEYLEEYNADGKYQFIFSKSFGGNLLVSEPALDITNEVLAGLNAKYRASAEEK